MVCQRADSALQASQLAKNACDVAGRGGTVVGDVVQTMKDINDSRRKVADIIGVIDSTAFQTKILALNDAVEAARVGELGSGFALLAAEVRRPGAVQCRRRARGQGADQCQRRTYGAGPGPGRDRGGSTVQEVLASIQRVRDIVGEISVASREQSEGVALVGNSINQMDQATQQNAALVEQSAAAAASLRDQANQLVTAVSGFKLP